MKKIIVALVVIASALSSAVAQKEVKYAKLFYKEVKINFVGSVAFYFQKQLCAVMSERGLQSGIILQSPMEGLVKYHLGK